MEQIISPTESHQVSDEATSPHARVAAYLREASAQGLPGFLGIEFVDVSPGHVEMRLPLREELLSTFGQLHGGVTAAFTDHLLGAAVLPLVEEGQWPATLEFKINYLSAVREGALEGVADVLALTRRTAVVRIDVRNRDRIVAAGQATVMIVDPQR